MTTKRDWKERYCNFCNGCEKTIDIKNRCNILKFILSVIKEEVKEFGEHLKKLRYRFIDEELKQYLSELDKGKK